MQPHAPFGISERSAVFASGVELRQLKTFEAVDRHRTVTGAAVALGLAPSSVSQQIRTLEDALGVTLFVRGPKGMELTPAGKRLRGWARSLLDQADRAVLDVRSQRQRLRLGLDQADRAVLDVRSQRQRLRLGALETLAGSHVPLVLARLAERRPDIDVDVHSDRARQGLFTDVVEGRLDVALLLDAGEDIGGLGFPTPGEPLTFIDLDPVPLALVAAPTHALAVRTALTPADLRDERLLVNVPECSFWMAGDRILGAGPERVRAGGVPVMRAWAEHGLGISLLPRFAVADSLRAGTLVKLDLPLPDLSLRLVWREDRESLPGMRDILYAAARP